MHHLLFTIAMALTAPPIATIDCPPAATPGVPFLIGTPGSRGAVYLWRVVPHKPGDTLTDLPLFQGLDAEGKPIISHIAYASFATPGDRLIVLIVAAENDVAIATAGITIGQKTPDPAPQPTPPPAGLSLLLVEDRQQRGSLTNDQLYILTNPNLLKTIATAGWTALGVIDAHQTGLPEPHGSMVKAIETYDLPRVVIRRADGSYWQCPMPQTTAAWTVFLNNPPPTVRKNPCTSSTQTKQSTRQTRGPASTLPQPICNEGYCPRNAP